MKDKKRSLGSVQDEASRIGSLLELAYNGIINPSSSTSSDGAQELLHLITHEYFPQLLVSLNEFRKQQ